MVCPRQCTKLLGKLNRGESKRAAPSALEGFALMVAIKPTAVFFPGESQGQRSLAGYSAWGHTESDTTERRARKLSSSPSPQNPEFLPGAWPHTVHSIASLLIPPRDWKLISKPHFLDEEH